MNLDTLRPSIGYVPKYRLFDVAILAHHYGVAAGTIRRWISEDQIPHFLAPAGSRERRRFDLNDIQAAYDKRHPRETDPLSLTTSPPAPNTEH